MWTGHRFFKKRCKRLAIGCAIRKHARHEAVARCFRVSRKPPGLAEPVAVETVGEDSQVFPIQALPDCDAKSGIPDPPGKARHMRTDALILALGGKPGLSVTSRPTTPFFEAESPDGFRGLPTPAET